MQKVLKSHHYPKKQDNPSKWIFLLLIKNPKKVKPWFVTPVESCVFGFLLINTSLKLHYKYMHTSAQKEEEASPRTSVIDYILQKFNSYLLSLSFPKLSRTHSQPFSAYSHHNTNIHHLAYTFLLHKRLITDQPSYPLWNSGFFCYFARGLASLKLTTHYL